MEDNLTTRQYWENYYTRSYTKDHIISVCSKYDAFWEILTKNNDRSPKDIIEIGGFPGRYLSYISAKYDLEPTCLDYNKNIEKSKFCFEQMGVKKYHLISADFDNFSPNKQYDIVLSQGFVEHFNNFNSILDKHVQYLRRGGTMMISVPNKRNLRYIYGLLVDHANLKKHNIKVIKKNVFEDFAKRNKLDLIKFQYHGGFPYAVHQKLNPIQRIIYRTTRAFFKKVNPFLEKHPNKYTCSSLICVFKKNW